ncbi:MAG TPA: DNA repair ATPase, partial [Thermoanaerobaculia bacterium]|nr:DNA repair ATPase [Thermoanaerobaculia bacterium]
AHDFEWTATTRDDHRRGRFPHVSVLDQVFVETVGGDLTIKVEDNTEDGRGVYREPVDEPDQSLDDAEISYARLGKLILLRVRPYREEAYRYLVFNTLNRKVDRLDAIGQACVQLPEDHGLIFPGGYYLRSGETKLFDLPTAGMEFKRLLRSPNGEDVLYVFHQRDEGRSVMLPYNLVRRQVDTPLQCHGFSFFADGTMVIFRATSDEPSRVHTLQIWQTPFCSPEHAAAAPRSGSYLDTLGNAELVRGISDLLSLRREIEEQTPSRAVYEHLIATARRAADSYHWLGRAEVGDLLATLRAVLAAAESIVDEFEKVEALRAEAGKAVAGAEEELAGLASRVRPADLKGVEAAVEALGRLRAVRGRIISLRELRYADLPRLDTLEKTAVGHFDAVAAAAVELLRSPESFAPVHKRLEELEAEIPRVATVAQAEPVGQAVEGLGKGLELLAEVVGTLPIPDATVRTAILEAISEAFGRVNRVRALLAGHRKALLEKEGMAEFGAQFKLFGQSVAGALALADTPEACDAQLAKLMLQLEELEGRFGEFEELLGRLTEKREEVFEAFATRKQALVDARQRRAGTLAEAAGRILDGIRRRSLQFATDDEVNAFFAADPMAAKVRDIALRLREVGDAVRADEIEGRLKAARQEAARALRDRRDLFEDGDAVIRLGRHRFSVNRQPLELTLVPRAGGLAFHLTGTDFFEPVADPEFEATRPFWEQSLVSETPEVYRGEFLAAQLLADAEAGRGGLSLTALRQGDLAETVRAYAAERYEEGYERGLHDHDAALILDQLLGLLAGAGLLRFSSRARAAAALFWAYFPGETERVAWQIKAGSLARLRSAYSLLSASAAGDDLAADIGEAVARFLAGLAASVADLGLETPDPAAVSAVAEQAGAYLAEELARQPVRWTASAAGAALRDRFLAQLEASGHGRDFAEDLRRLDGDLAGRFGLARAWVGAAAAPGEEELVPEAVALLLTGGKTKAAATGSTAGQSDARLEARIETAATTVRVEGLLGQHPRIAERSLDLRLDEFLARLAGFRAHRVPGFRDFQARRHRLLEDGRRRLRLGELVPRVMSTFVRNRLIDEVYLPLIGDNLAKQLGTVGEGQRTDRMGLLLLVSPPGYGKTTLLEYVASRLGLTFLKVNGPALGHGVRSLDPAEAPNATARQEVDKINLALEMGSNVMLYLDDIQHTSPELLQKFISLCDAQRKIEGVWKGKTRTYDLRGKKFCIVMAGNPYTESGETFRIPDMLANRADVYNLGDVLSGKGDAFSLSFLENALTSNPTLAPLATRDLGDVYKLISMAKGQPVPTTELSHG